MQDCERLLIRAPNWLGDAVMALPALAAVRRAYPSSTIVVAARAGVAPLFRERTAAAPNASRFLRNAFWNRYARDGWRAVTGSWARCRFRSAESPFAVS